MFRHTKCCKKAVHSIGFYVFNTNLTFLYNIDIQGFKKFQQKIKLPRVGFELTTAAITGLEFQLPYPLSQSVFPCQSQILRPLSS